MKEVAGLIWATTQLTQLPEEVERMQGQRQSIIPDEWRESIQKKTTQDTIIQSRKRIIAPPFGKSLTPGPLGTVKAQSQHSDRRCFVSFFKMKINKITNTSWLRRNRSGTDLAWQEKFVLLLCKYVNFYSKRWLSSWNWPYLNPRPTEWSVINIWNNKEITPWHIGPFLPAVKSYTLPNIYHTL